MKRTYFDEEVFTKRNKDNRKNIGDDAVNAKISGVSYGKYKAGLGQEFEETEYPVSTAEHIKQSPEKTAQAKACAYIR